MLKCYPVKLNVLDVYMTIVDITNLKIIKTYFPVFSDGYKLSSYSIALVEHAKSALLAFHVYKDVERKVRFLHMVKNPNVTTDVTFFLDPIYE